MISRMSLPVTDNAYGTIANYGECGSSVARLWKFPDSCHHEIASCRCLRDAAGGRKIDAFQKNQGR
jgi:hypothetical protein